MKRFARARKNKQLVAGSALALFILLLAVVGPMLFGDYNSQNLALSHNRSARMGRSSEQMAWVATSRPGPRSASESAWSWPSQ
jgi:hypothetical protein